MKPLIIYISNYFWAKTNWGPPPSPLDCPFFLGFSLKKLLFTTPYYNLRVLRACRLFKTFHCAPCSKELTNLTHLTNLTNLKHLKHLKHLIHLTNNLRWVHRQRMFESKKKICPVLKRSLRWSFLPVFEPNMNVFGI